MDAMLKSELRRNLLRYAIGRVITCEHEACERVLDVRSAVLATIDYNDGTERAYCLCGACWDQTGITQATLDASAARFAESTGQNIPAPSLDVIDGRNFPADCETLWGIGGDA